MRDDDLICRTESLARRYEFVLHGHYGRGRLVEVLPNELAHVQFFRDQKIRTVDLGRLTWVAAAPPAASIQKTGVRA